MKRKSTLNFSHALLFIGFTEVIFWTIFTLYTKEARRAKLMHSITNSKARSLKYNFFSFNLLTLSYYPSGFTKKVPPGFLDNILISGLFST